MTDLRCARVFFGLFFVLAVLGDPVATIAQSSPSGREPGARDVIDDLRQGGYVIYFRHATTNPDQADTDTTKLDRCETQRNLSAGGRRMARDLGLTFQALRIPVGYVVTSPYCRAVDTATLAFGRHETSSALYFAIDVEKEQRDRQSAELREMLATPPKPGTNTVIVSHHANLKEATGIWPKREGDAHVFRPRPGGGFDHVGEVAVEEWRRRIGRGGQATRTGGGP